MLFVYPMWDSESERIGKQKCTPLGYTLHLVADLIGFVGLLLLIGSVAYVAYLAFRGEFHASLLSLPAVPFDVGITGQILHQYSWRLAYRKGFEYDYHRCEASWTENGERVTFKWTAPPNPPQSAN